MSETLNGANGVNENAGFEDISDPSYYEESGTFTLFNPKHSKGRFVANVGF